MESLRNVALRGYLAMKTRSEEGQGLAEYGLILALIAVVCAGALVALEGGITGTLNSVAAKL